MRDLLVAFIAVAIVVSLLRSGSTPWELLSKDEINQQISTAVSSAVAAATAAQARAAKSRGPDWMWSPDRQSPLDKPAAPVGHGGTGRSTSGS